MKNMIISVGAENTFNKIKHLFMIKTLEKLGREGNILTLIKYITKPYILNGKKLEASLLRSGIR